jgi:hypothetical protein
MPDSLQRWATIALHPASTARSDEHAELLEVRVAHPVGVVLEVARGRLEVAGFFAGQREGAGGGADRLDVAVIQLGQPVVLAVTEHEVQQFCQVVQVLAGVIQIDDLRCPGEVGGGEVPDPRCPVAEDDQLADVAGAAAAGLGGHERPERGGRGEGGYIRGGRGVADRAAVLTDGGLGERDGHFHLPGAGGAVLAFPGPAFGFGRGHGYAGPVDGDIQHVGQRRGRRQRRQRACLHGGSPRFDHCGGGPPVSLGAPPGAPAGQGYPG